MFGEYTRGLRSFRATADRWVNRYTTIPFGIISVLCCLALPNIKKYMTNRVAVVSVLLPSEQASTEQNANFGAGYPLAPKKGL